MDCEQSLFCSKIRWEERKEERNTSEQFDRSSMACEKPRAATSAGVRRLGKIGRRRIALLQTPALLAAARMSLSQSRSHAHLFCVLPTRIFEQNRDSSQSSVATVQ